MAVKSWGNAKSLNKVSIFTDGGCHGNPGIGGWAYVVYNSLGDKIHDCYGGDQYTTNNIMELTAVLQALTYGIKNEVEISDINIDSKYVQQGISSWMYSWKSKGWKKSNGEIIKNKALWEETFETVQIYRNKFKTLPDFIKVAGHAGIEGNEAADILTQVAISELELNDIF